jgi:hypothetical protein
MEADKKRTMRLTVEALAAIIRSGFETPAG